MRIFVTGGAGYIGGITARMLLDHGHDVIVFDNLERGHREALDARARVQGWRRAVQVEQDLRLPALAVRSGGILKLIFCP